MGLNFKILVVYDNIQNCVLQSIPFLISLDETLMTRIMLYLQPLKIDAGVTLYHRGGISSGSNF